MAIPLSSGAAGICFPRTYKDGYERMYRLMEVAEFMAGSATSSPER